MERFLTLVRSPGNWNAVIALVSLMGILWIWASAIPAAATTGGLVPAPREGFPAPDFTLPALDGGDMALSALRGQVVIINLWTAWCPPCREEMPALDEAYRRYREQGLVVLGVNSTFQDDEETAVRFVRELGLTFPILLDRQGTVSRRYELQALPTTYFVDRQGVIRDVVLGGPMSMSTMESKILGLLATTGAER